MGDLLPRYNPGQKDNPALQWSKKRIKHLTNKLKNCLEMVVKAYNAPECKGICWVVV